jgi:hypothetical protein
VIPAGQGAAGRHPGLRASLLAAVRPEFRADVLVFDPQDPVFGGKLCLVTGCGRTAGGQELCPGHWRRWTAAGRPGVRAFAAAADPGWRGKDAPLACCGAPGCGYGVGRRKDLCVRHACAWERAGMPDLGGWLGGQPGGCGAGGLRDQQLPAVGRTGKVLVPLARRGLEAARPAACRGVRRGLGRWRRGSRL